MNDEFLGGQTTDRKGLKKEKTKKNRGRFCLEENIFTGGYYRENETKNVKQRDKLRGSRRIFRKVGGHGTEIEGTNEEEGQPGETQRMTFWEEE